jgi:peptidoglycan/LPS O-acetylase OafA/YrhL
MRALLEKRNSIYGACAIWIVLFHTFRRISMPYIPIAINIVSIGNLAVDVFFFFSGLCLSLSAGKHDYQKTGWRPYFKKRLSRVLLPYLLIGIPYYIWAAVCETSGSVLRRGAAFLADLSSASFWLKGMQTTWFVYGILLFYTLFPAIYAFVKRSGSGKKIAFLFGLILFAVAAAYTPVLKNSMIVWVRLPVFSIGVMAGTLPEQDKVPGKGPTAAAALLVVLLGWLTSLSELSESFTIPAVYKLLLFLPLSLSLLMLLSRFGKRVRFLKWAGGLSLEIYLVHITLLHPLKYYGIIEALGYWLYICLPAAALLLAWIVGEIEKHIRKRGEKHESLQHL